jgi:hypothetical protein
LLAEPVGDVDHPVYVPGQPDRHGNELPVLRRFQVTGEDDDPVTDGGRDAARIHGQHVIEQLADAPGDLVVRPQEDAQQVAPGDDAD